MASIKEVAALAGVNPKTAQRALAGITLGKHADARERAERVRQAAAQLGYRQSAIARALRCGKTRTIGLVVGSVTNRYFGSLIETVMDECEKFGYHLSLELTRWNLENNLNSIEKLLRRRVDGIFYASTFRDEEKQLLQKTFQIGTPIEVLYRNKFDLPYVCRNYGKSLQQAVRHLQAQGQTEITASFWQSLTLHDEYSAKQFTAACAKAGVQGATVPIFKFADTKNIVQKAPAALICDAPYCLNYFCEQKKDNYHPAIVGIFDEWNYVVHPQQLAGLIMVPSEKQVRTAVRGLLAQISGESIKNQIVESRFYPLKSLRPCPDRIYQWRTFSPIKQNYLFFIFLPVFRDEPPKFGFLTMPYRPNRTIFAVLCPFLGVGNAFDRLREVHS